MTTSIKSYQISSSNHPIEYSASIENDCGNRSSITWSRNRIRLPGRSSGCIGWTKSMQQLSFTWFQYIHFCFAIHFNSTGTFFAFFCFFLEQNGAQAWYVPECTADGRFQRIQCYRSAGYCWCVHEDTGKNIPGTSIKDGRPDCAINFSRPMKGCPEPRKLEFLKELKEFLRTKIATSTGWVGHVRYLIILPFCVRF